MLGVGRSAAGLSGTATPLIVKAKDTRFKARCPHLIAATVLPHRRAPQQRRTHHQMRTTRFEAVG
jgi:hypothetical protein